MKAIFSVMILVVIAAVSIMAANIVAVTHMESLVGQWLMTVMIPLVMTTLGGLILLPGVAREVGV